MYENSIYYLPPWRSVTIIVPERADSQAGHWVTFILCTSFPQFRELLQSSWNHWECCSYLLCVLCQVPQVSKENHFWLADVISLEYLCLLWMGRVVLLIHTVWSGKHVTVAVHPEDFQKHLLLLPLFLSSWPQLWQEDSWVPFALFISAISSALILVCS